MKQVKKLSWTNTSKAVTLKKSQNIFPVVCLDFRISNVFPRCLLNVRDHKFGYHFNMEVIQSDLELNNNALVFPLSISFFQDGVINNRGMFDRAIGLGRRRR